MFDVIFRFPIGTKVVYDGEEHEVNGYKQLSGTNYVLFKDGECATANALNSLVKEKTEA